MMTDEQLKALEAARGTEFDRLFLIAMIKHHEGAIDDGRGAVQVVRRGAG